MTDIEVLKLIKSLRQDSRDVVKYETSNCLKRLPAYVISADNTNSKATVRLFLSPDDNGQNMELLNNSGKDLVANDNVFIEYWSSLTNAYIAIKNDGTPWNACPSYTP
jgi:hypothetical protein